MKTTTLTLALLLAVTLARARAQDVPQPDKPEPQHAILQKLAGNWVGEGECHAPDGKSYPSKSTESNRMLGELWVLANIKGEFGGMKMEGMATLGYDAKSKKYVGTWVDSCMNHLWKYEGEADAAGKTLTMMSEGPMGGDKMTKTRDIWEFQDADHRTMRSETQGPDGKWIPVMSMKYTRAK